MGKEGFDGLKNSIREGDGTKTEEFLKKFQGGGVIFNPKIYVADFG